MIYNRKHIHVGVYVSHILTYIYMYMHEILPFLNKHLRRDLYTCFRFTLQYCKTDGDDDLLRKISHASYTIGFSHVSFPSIYINMKYTRQVVTFVTTHTMTFDLFFSPPDYQSTIYAVCVLCDARINAYHLVV